jgi:hypothetical protein
MVLLGWASILSLTLLVFPAQAQFGGPQRCHGLIVIAPPEISGVRQRNAITLNGLPNGVM